jgi:hypothetical protein
MPLHGDFTLTFSASVTIGDACRIMKRRGLSGAYVAGPYSDRPPYKIGHTVNLLCRMRSLQHFMWTPVCLQAVFAFPEVDSAQAFERTMHAALSYDRLMGEWFNSRVSVISAAAKDILGDDYDRVLMNRSCVDEIPYSEWPLRLSVEVHRVPANAVEARR